MRCVRAAAAASRTAGADEIFAAVMLAESEDIKPDLVGQNDFFEQIGDTVGEFLDRTGPRIRCVVNKAVDAELHVNELLSPASSPSAPVRAPGQGVRLVASREAMVAGGFHALLAERRVSYDGSCPSAAEAVILATCDFLTQNHSGKASCERHSPFQPLVDAAIVAAIRRVLMGGVSSHGTGNDGIQPEIVATAASWAIYGAARGWFTECQIARR